MATPHSSIVTLSFQFGNVGHGHLTVQIADCFIAFRSEEDFEEFHHPIRLIVDTALVRQHPEACREGGHLQDSGSGLARTLRVFGLNELHDAALLIEDQVSGYLRVVPKGLVDSVTSGPIPDYRLGFFRSGSPT